MRWPRLSLTQRVTLLFAGLTTLVVLGLGALILLEVNQHFADMDHAELQEKRMLIDAILTESNSEDDARWRLGEALRYHEDLFVILQDAAGRTIYNTSNLGAATLRFNDLDSAHATFGAADVNGAVFRTLSFNAAPGSVHAASAVMVGVDTRMHTRFLEELAHDLLFYLLVAIVLCATLAWLAAHQGLAPLRRMRARAAVVAGSRLDERMPVHSVPPEMAALARELNRMLDRLQENFQRLSEFSANIAHELRTPISNLLAQTQVTLSVPRDTATYRDTLASNVEELEWLGRMVSDMLLLAKTERGVDALHLERFDARTEIQALLDYYAVLAEEKRVQLQLQGQAEMWADRLLFQRAVSNLLSNAVRHAPEDGVIAVLVSATAQAVTIRVENTGQGIAAVALPRLFERFYHGDDAAAGAGVAGTGLGLAITRAIVRAHGGSVAVTSVHGRTCFSLTFPPAARTPATQSGRWRDPRRGW